VAYFGVFAFDLTFTAYSIYFFKYTEYFASDNAPDAIEKCNPQYTCKINLNFPTSISRFTLQMYCGLHFQFRRAHYHSCNTLYYMGNGLKSGDLGSHSDAVLLPKNVRIGKCFFKIVVEAEYNVEELHLAEGQI
jgi:hypothetical protein